MPSKSALSSQAQRQRKAQRGDLEYQKQVAQRLLNVMDEGSLWHLAHELERRGLIRAGEGGFEVVGGDEPAAANGDGPSVPTAAARMGQSDCPACAQGELAAAGDSATPADADQRARAGAAAPAAADSPATRLRGPEARRGAPPASRGRSSYSPTAGAPGQESAVTGGPIGVAPSIQEKGEADEGACTTLIIRNLPSDFSQQLAEEWVDARGYRGLYDFLLFFPAKRATGLNASSYVFANFRSAEDARRFHSENHLLRLCAGKWALSVAAAKVQGFAENYVRFHHLTGSGGPTLCQPFFARDSVDRLPEEAYSMAASAARSQRLGSLQGLPHSTLIIRNLPHSVDSQEGARDWLDSAGFAGKYDFFLYLPAKRRRPEPVTAGGPPQGLAYAFVNFLQTDAALACIEALSGRAFSEGGPVLDVVAARVQGLGECLRHFSSIGDHGRVAPWVARGVDCEPPPYRYQ